MQSEPKMWKLLQAAKNLNVGIKNIADYLNSLGYVVENNPNFKISSEMYQLVEIAFTDNLSIKKEDINLHQKDVIIQDIAKIHENIFNFLYQEHKKNQALFLFTLRKYDKIGKFSKKYWFSGNERSLFFSFWRGNDKINKTPNIYFSVDIDGNTYLNLSALKNPSLKTDDEAINKTMFLNSLAKVLNMKQIKQNGEFVNQWQKSYQISPIENEPIYITSLKHFLQTDKVEIDKLINFAESMQPNLLGTNYDKIGKLDNEAFKADLLKTLLHTNDNNTVIKTKNLNAIHHFLTLKNLKLTHIGHFENLELDLSKRVTILIGENGTGKSTILRAIVLALIGINESKILNLQHTSLQNLLQMEGTMLSKINYAPQGKIELNYEYNGNSYINSIKLQHSEKNIAVDISEENFDTTINSFGVFETDEFRTLVMGFPQVQGGTNEKLNEWIPTHKDIMQPHTKDIINLLYNEPADWVDSLNSWIVDLYKGDAVKHRKGEAMQNQPIIDSVFEIISEVTSRKITFYDLINENITKSRVRILIENETTPIPLDLISQGYKNVFGWVAQLVKRLYDVHTMPNSINKLLGLAGLGKIDLNAGKGTSNSNSDKKNNLKILRRDRTKDFFYDSATVFIDEIDTYLHPSWQTKILSVLVRRFPNVRWVVTTHSPAVITNTYYKDASVYWIKGNEVKNMKYFYGRDFISAYYEFFGIEKRPKEIQNQINIMFDYLDQETEESIAKAKELYLHLKEFLGDNDPDIVGAYTNLAILNAWEGGANDSN